MCGLHHRQKGPARLLSATSQKPGSVLVCGIVSVLMEVGIKDEV